MGVCRGVCLVFAPRWMRGGSQLWLHFPALPKRAGQSFPAPRLQQPGSKPSTRSGCALKKFDAAVPETTLLPRDAPEKWVRLEELLVVRYHSETLGHTGEEHISLEGWARLIGGVVGILEGLVDPMLWGIC